MPRPLDDRGTPPAPAQARGGGSARFPLRSRRGPVRPDGSRTVTVRDAAGRLEGRHLEQPLPLRWAPTALPGLEARREADPSALPEWACRECCRTPLCPDHRYRLDGCPGCAGTGDTRRREADPSARESER